MAQKAPHLLPDPSPPYSANRLLLVSCYESGFQPLGIAWPAQALEQAGISFRVHDLSLAPLQDLALKEARCLVISTPMHTALRLGMQLAARAKALNPALQVVFHGLYARIQAEQLLKGCADAVVESEDPRALLHHLMSSGFALPSEQLAPVLTPRRAELPALGRYAKLKTVNAELEVAAMTTSQGCKYRCRHCPVPVDAEGSTQLIPYEGLLADLEAVVEAGAKHISFVDPDFLNHPEHSLGFLGAMHDSYPALSFDFTARVGHLLAHEQSFPELLDLGCAFVVSAVECLNDDVLKRLNKGHTAAQVRLLLERSTLHGLTVRPTLLPFTPWSGPEDLIELFELVEAADVVDQIDPVQLTVRLLLPAHSLLLKEASLAPHLGGFDSSSMSHRWAHPNPRMDRLQQRLQARVELGIEQGEEHRAVYLALRALVRAEFPALASQLNRALPTEKPPAPRLTEPWFC